MTMLPAEPRPRHLFRQGATVEQRCRPSSDLCLLTVYTTAGRTSPPGSIESAIGAALGETTPRCKSARRCESHNGDLPAGKQRHWSYSIMSQNAISNRRLPQRTISYNSIRSCFSSWKGPCVEGTPIRPHLAGTMSLGKHGLGAGIGSPRVATLSGTIISVLLTHVKTYITGSPTLYRCSKH